MRPYHRSARQFTDGSYSEGGRWSYIIHPSYAKSPEQYIRAFQIILKDLQKLFDYIEPADGNSKSYSFRTHELLTRVCIEVEANFKAILLENHYPKKETELEIEDYKKIEKTHRLSSYEIKLPHWLGNKSIRTPFKNWVRGEHNPAWYVAYNKAKHNRHEHFHLANFENLIDSVCGLLVLLSSQFHTEEFSPADYGLSLGNLGQDDGMESAIGGYFRIKFPNDWPVDEQYEFTYEEWKVMEKEHNPFQKIDYSKI